jgi:hypothetical protein
MLQAFEEFPIVGEARQAVVSGTEPDFILRFLAFGDIQRHSDAADNRSLRIAVRSNAQVVEAIAAGIFEPRRNPSQCQKVLFRGRPAVLLASQVLIDGLAYWIPGKTPRQTGCAPPMGRHSQAQIGGPEEEWNLFHQKPQVRLRYRAGSAWRQNMSPFQDANHLPLRIANRRAVDPDRNPKPVPIKALCHGACRELVQGWFLQEIVVSRQFIHRQKAGDRFADNFRLGKAIELFRGFVPEKNSSFQSKSNDRFSRIGKQCLQENAGIRLGRHLGRPVLADWESAVDGGRKTQP